MQVSKRDEALHLKLKNKQALTYSKSQVAKAGHVIRKNEGDRVWAMQVIQEFRSSFLYPLKRMSNFLDQNAKAIDGQFHNQDAESAIVVRRLKRFPTILDKLSRTSLDGKASNGIDLSRMQDIGGCRVIVENYEQLCALYERLKHSKSQHVIFREKSYLQEARSSGYRGIHLIYKCFHRSENAASQPWKDCLIEVQLRTKIQHAWSTAVELVDLFENTDLKTNVHTKAHDWRRFFWLISELFAEKDRVIRLEENLRNQYLSEALALDQSLEVYAKMALFQQSFSNPVVIENTDKSSYTLMLVNKVTKEGVIYAFDDEASAFESYAKAEEDSAFLVLLVAGSNFASLKKAYPNYLINTEKFLYLMQDLFSEQRDAI